MRLPEWAQPLTPHAKRCECDYQFPALARVTIEVMRRVRKPGSRRGKEQYEVTRHKLRYNLCRVCIVYHREWLNEITFAQSERWTRRLIRALLERKDYRPPEPRKVEYQKHGKRRRKRKADETIPLDVPHMPVQPEAARL